MNLPVDPHVDEQDNSGVVSSSIANQTSPIGRDTGLSPTRVVGAILAAVFIGWAFNTWVPPFFTIPEHLLGVDMYSPKAIIDEHAEVAPIVDRNNSLVHFSILSMAMGLVPISLFYGSQIPGRIRASLAGIFAGLVLGPLTYWVGMNLRHQVSYGTVPLFGDISESMVGDLLVISTVGVMISLPVLIGLILIKAPCIREKAIVIPLAGVIAGLLFPVLVSFLMPSGKTNMLPLARGGVLGLWLGVLGIMMIVLLINTGLRKSDSASVDS